MTSRSTAAGSTGRRQRLHLELRGEPREVSLEVLRLDPPAVKERAFVVIFDEVPASPPPPAGERQPTPGGTERRAGRATRRGAGAPAIAFRGSRGDERGTAGFERRGPVGQRGIPKPQRGTGNVQGRTRIHQRRADHRQRRDGQSQRRIESRQERPEQSSTQHQSPRLDARAQPAHPPLHARNAVAVQTRAFRHRTAGSSTSKQRSTCLTSKD